MVSKLVQLSFFLVFSICIFGRFHFSKAHKAPAMYVFGDALVDVGNNDRLTFSFNKANFPHYGIDFHNKQATGTFGNGKNTADFLGKLSTMHDTKYRFHLFLVQTKPNLYNMREGQIHSCGRTLIVSTFCLLCMEMLQLRKLACQLHHHIFT